MLLSYAAYACASSILLPPFFSQFQFTSPRRPLQPLFATDPETPGQPLLHAGTTTTRRLHSRQPPPRTTSSSRRLSRHHLRPRAHFTPAFGRLSYHHQVHHHRLCLKLKMVKMMSKKTWIKLKHQILSMLKKSVTQMFRLYIYF
ncbi:uncharacterized protein LOC131024039 [Salvia miltiorrhiza]|uniref:uncharacterized protein LOC131024039 n=1 Tax=Salvia miltiorrhiza TaxID=226208 RepID=UPI0025AC8EA0|nr:uncharacterized protein LOC131024039 [Salvia miltiorrhiza]